MGVSRSKNNKDAGSIYDIWRNNALYSNFSVAIMNLDGKSDVKNRSFGTIVKEFNKVSDLNIYLKNSSFEYTLLIYADCEVSPSICDVYSEILLHREDIDILYSDEDIRCVKDDSRTFPFFKPDFSPDTLMSFPYIGKVFLFRTKLIEEVGFFDESLGYETYYDFLLKCFEKGKKFYHTPRVLFSQVRESGDYEYFDANDNIRICQENSLVRRGIFATMALEKRGGSFVVDYAWDDKPLVSIVIPSKDNFDVMKRCVDSILKLTAYKNYEIILVDNGSSDDNREMYSKYTADNSIKYVYGKKDFNFSYMCNVGASHAKGEYLLFLNDDIEIIDVMWLSKLLGQAELPHSGAIGCKLLFGDKERIQHCGVINNLGPTHAFWGFSDYTYYCFGRNRYNYNYLAVTGACLMVSRAKFDEVDGFNNDLSICYNDVDLCFKLYEHGYYNTVRNDVTLLHYESVSRGSDYKDEETEKRLNVERKLLWSLHPDFVKKDPFYNINLTQEKVDFDLRESGTGSVNEIDLTNVKKTDSFMNIDSVEVGDEIKIRGWIISKTDLRTLGCKLSVVLRSDENVIEADAVRQIRTDVQESMGLKVSDIGFNCVLPKEYLQPCSNYTIGVIVRNPEGQAEVTWTKEKI